MSLIKTLHSFRQFGRPKLIQMILFWFEEYVISLYNEFKLEQKSYDENKEKSNLVKKTFKT